jgi:acetyl-CoA synthetase
MTDRETFAPSEQYRRNTGCSALQYQAMYERSVSNPEEFWAAQAQDLLTWRHPWRQVVEWDFKAAQIGWFVGGKLNVSENCVDRHLASKGSKVAIIWEGNEPGDVRTITYAELHREVCKAATLLRKLGVKKGDRVAIYLPMIPEAAVVMLACTRIGAIHTVVFAGFSSEALRDRINDCGCSLVITANEVPRRSHSRRWSIRRFWIAQL